LIKRYDIKARYLLSVHDELRYLAEDTDKYRTALALQIANAWTRALFCYNLGIDDVPQGVTFFSAVDIDHVLRKEVNMPCITPSHPTEIPAGESLDIEQLLVKTQNGALGSVTAYDADFVSGNSKPPVTLFPDIDSTLHYLFLRAQSERHGQRAKAWLDRQTVAIDSRGVPVGPKLGRGQGIKIERLRDATQHLRGNPTANEVRDALESFETEMEGGRVVERE
jgi:DNA polymerase gamma 1